MICDNERKISSTLYKLLYSLHIHDRYSAKWIDKVKCILTECGMSDFWYDQSKVKSLSFCNFKKIFKKKLSEFYKKISGSIPWNNQVNAHCTGILKMN